MLLKAYKKGIVKLPGQISLIFYMMGHDFNFKLILVFS